MTQPTCATCRWFHANDNTSECRRYPPVLAWWITQPCSTNDGRLTSGDDEGTEKYAFPSIDEDGWCGEHSPKESASPSGAGSEVSTPPDPESDPVARMGYAEMRHEIGRLRAKLREERAHADRAVPLLLCHYGYRDPCIKGQNVPCAACQCRAAHDARRAASQAASLRADAGGE